MWPSNTLPPLTYVDGIVDIPALKTNVFAFGADISWKVSPVGEFWASPGNISVVIPTWTTPPLFHVCLILDIPTLAVNEVAATPIVLNEYPCDPSGNTDVVIPALTVPPDT